MKLELEEVQARIARTQDEQHGYVEMAKQWEKMWRLEHGWERSTRDSVMKDGREQVTTPDPYNIVNLAMRLIPSQPKIDIPPREIVEGPMADAEQIERWLTAMYARVNKQQGRNLIDDLKWLIFVRGKAYVQALWVEDDLPKLLRKRNFPILVRCLDPLNVGYHRGPLYVEWAYHQYEADRVDIRQRYPHLNKWDEPKPPRLTDDEGTTVTVTDFWYMGQGGAVWHCIIVDEEFAKEPVKTEYPIIPIIEASGDTAPTEDKSHQALSILHPLDGLWQYKNRLESNLGTAVLWYTWPFFLVTSPMGHQLDDVEVRPGATVPAVEGTQVQEVRPQANAQLLESMLQKVDTSIQQATFPGVLYGDAGNMQAGYGVNILSQAATGRVQAARDALERCLMWLNECVLALVETFGDDENGVELWGRDEGSEKLYKACIYPSQIDGYYENDVQLKPVTPQDDMQKQTLGIRLADGKYISKRTLRDKYLSITVPSDEERRIMAEMALEEPTVAQVLALTRLIEAYPETWESLVKGTQLEEQAYRIAMETLGIPVEPPMPEPQPMLPPEPPVPSGMGPPMEQPPMPPPGMVPPPIQPEAALVPPMGGGIPPELQGQLQGENLGLPPDLPPEILAQIMGQPLPPGEELDELAGVPPGVI